MEDLTPSTKDENEHEFNWRKEARFKQSFYCGTLGVRRWEIYEKKTDDDMMYLKLKLGFFLYGPPTNVDEKCNDLKEFYSDDKQKKGIEILTDLIMQKCDSELISVAFIFIVAYFQNKYYSEYPFIRILTGKSEDGNDISCFVDPSNRVYSDWNNLLESNIIPNCEYCYPKNGYYYLNADGEVEIEFGVSPSSHLLSNYLSKFDFASGIIGIVGGIGMLTPVGPAVYSAFCVSTLCSSFWSTVRTSLTMYDRYMHDQSISPLDFDSLLHWISILGGIFAGASGAQMKYTTMLARSGQVLSNSTVILFNGIEVCNIGISGFGLLTHIWLLATKEDKITKIDIFQATISILFFCHAAVSFRTVNDVILEVQNNTLNSYQSSLTRKQRKVFKKSLRDTVSVHENVISGNARVIRSVKNITNKEMFFKELTYLNKKANKSKSTTSFTEEGGILLNNKIEIQPDVLNKLTNKSKKILLNSSNKYKNKPTYDRSFKRKMKNLAIKDGVRCSLKFPKNNNRIQINEIKKSNVIEKTNYNDSENNCKLFEFLEDIISNKEILLYLQECGIYITDHILKWMKTNNSVRKEVFRISCHRRIKKDTPPFNAWDYFKNCIQIYFLSVINEEDVDIREEGDVLEYRFKEEDEINEVHILLDRHDNTEHFQIVFFKDLNEEGKWSPEQREPVRRDTFFRLTEDNISLTPWQYFEIYLKNSFNHIEESDIIIIEEDRGWTLVFINVNREIKYVKIDLTILDDNSEMIETFSYRINVQINEITKSNIFENDCNIFTVLKDITSNKEVLHYLEEHGIDVDLIFNLVTSETSVVEEVFRISCHRRIKKATPPFKALDYFKNCIQIYFLSVINEEDVDIREEGDVLEYRFKEEDEINEVHILLDRHDNTEHFQIVFFKDLNEEGKWSPEQRETVRRDTFFRLTEDNISLTPWQYFEIYLKNSFNHIEESDIITIEEDRGWTLVFINVNREIKYVKIDLTILDDNSEMIEASCFIF